MLLFQNPSVTVHAAIDDVNPQYFAILTIFLGIAAGTTTTGANGIGIFLNVY